MPIHIDHMDTTIDMTPPENGPAEESATAPAPPPTADLRERIGRVLRDELADFLRQRGM